MNRLLAIIGFALSLGVPAQAMAMQSETYDLRAGLVNARWEGKGDITMKQEPNGILLTSGAATGTFLTSELPKFTAETATLFVTAENTTAIRFMWVRPNQLFASVGLTVYGGNNRSLSFSLRSNTEWKGSIRAVGLLLPPHTTVLLNRIDLTRWSFAEKLSAGFRTFFTQDEYRPYSINFLWGPVIGLNPIEEHSVFQDLPPQQIYATYALNVILLLSLGLLALFARYGRPAGLRRIFVVRSFSAIALAVWIIMDVRMGSEFLSWVANDQKTYMGATASERTFRDRGQFYDFAAFVKPFLFDRDSYAFFAEQAWPYLGNMRYLTYPSIPGIDIDRDDTWVIYGRPDISVNERGEISIDGQPVSAPGKILARYDDSSFVFRTFTPPSPQ